MHDDDVCIVGLGCVLPDANNKNQFWENIIVSKCSIRAMPENKFSRNLYYSNTGEEDKSCSYNAAFIEDSVVENLRHNLSLGPKLNRLNIITLEAARQALEGINKKNLGSVRSSIILGSSWSDQDHYIGNLIAEDNNLRKYIKTQINNSGKINIKVKNYLEARRKDMPKLDQINNTSICESIKKKYKLKSDYLIVDAACASSLASIAVSVKRLKSFETDLVITGGMDASLVPTSFAIFTTTGTLAKNRCYPFDKRTRGLSQGEGAVVFVLQRLKDALNDDNKIFAVIKSVGSASDGKSVSLFEPYVGGQLMALEKAYGDEKDVDFIECHGTGTVIGDTIELKALREFFKDRKKPLNIGSVKSLIGHTKGTAGAASLLKAVLSIENRTLPPSKYFSDILVNGNKKITLNRRPIKVKHNNRLTVGVSSFGFGGINYHVILEEFLSESKIKKSTMRERKDIVVVAKSYRPKITGENSYRIPPKSLDQIDIRQIMALDAVVDALTSSKISLENIDKSKVSVIATGFIGTDKSVQVTKRVLMPELLDPLKGYSASTIKKILDYKNKFPKLTEDSGAGILSNVIASRVCNVFDFKGANYNIDSDYNSLACGLRSAVDQIQQDESEIVIVIGSDEKLDDSKLFHIRKGLYCFILTSRNFANKHHMNPKIKLEKIEFE